MNCPLSLTVASSTVVLIEKRHATCKQVHCDSKLYKTMGEAAPSEKGIATETAGNQADSLTGTLVSALSGVDTVVIISLDVMRLPAVGGNAHDHKVWPQSVNGVSSAWVSPCRAASIHARAC